MLDLFLDKYIISRECCSSIHLCPLELLYNSCLLTRVETTHVEISYKTTVTNTVLTCLDLFLNCHSPKEYSDVCEQEGLRQILKTRYK